MVPLRGRHIAICYQRELKPWPIDVKSVDGAMKLAKELSYCVGDTLVVTCDGKTVAEFRPREE